MKALILAAGLGQRMLPLTATTPKPLLKVAGKPLLEHHISNLKQAGIDDIVINTAYLAEQIEARFQQGQELGVSICYSREPHPLETGGAIVQALPLLGDDEFLLVNGDIYTDYPFKALLSVKTSWAHLVLTKNPEHNPQGDFALQQGCLSQSESPKFTYMGVGVYNAQMFAGYQAGEKFSVVPILKQHMSHQRITGELYQGRWFDIGTPARLQQINQLLAEEKNN